MKVIFVILLTIVSLPIHWHYYRWCVFNPRFNRPSIYRSGIGDLIVVISTIIWFGLILLSFKWYFIFIPIVILFILKEIAISQAINSVKKEYIKNGNNEKEAFELARSEVKNYSNK